MSQNFFINSKKIENSGEIYIIAEAGINHNGCLDNARQLIDMAVEAGCDAVKFQKRDLASIYTKEVLENLSDQQQGFQYLIPILKDYELSNEQMTIISSYCRKRCLLYTSPSPRD